MHTLECSFLIRALQRRPDDRCVVGILQLAGAGCRQPLPDLFDAAAAGVEQLMWQAGIASCGLTNCLRKSDLSSKPAAAAGQLRLALGLLQTHAIPAAARQLATLAYVLRSSAVPLSPARFKAVAEYLQFPADLPSWLLTLGKRASSPPDLTRDVLVAVADSSFVDHAGRLVLLLRGCHPPGDALLHNLAQADHTLANVYTHAFHAIADSASPFWRVLTGPCARHAAVVVGLSALGELEGEAEGQGPGGAACACLGPRLRHGDRITLPLCALTTTLQPALPAPLRPITATRLLLRVGLAAVRSGSQPGGAPGGAAGAAGTSGSIVGLLDVGRRVLDCTPRYLAAHVPWRGPWLGAAADTWRLTAALLGPAAAGNADAIMRTTLVRTLRSLLSSCGTMTGRFCFAADPPPPVASALAGGALPLLERLLRRAGEAPEGLEAAVMAGLEDMMCPDWSLPLLAYGEPLQAAAVVTTVAKLLRRAEARGLFSLSAGEGFSVLHDILYSLRGDTNPDAAAPPVLSRLALVLSLALPEWLPALSRLALRAAAEDEAAWRKEQEQGRGEQCSTDSDAGPLPPLYCNLLAALATPYALCRRRAPSSSLAAAEGSPPAGSGGAGSSSTGCSADRACRGKGGPDSSDGGMEWRLPELEMELDLVGAALRLLHRRRPDPLHVCTCSLYAATGSDALRLVATRPCEVRALAASGSPFAWRPETVPAVAEVVRRAADDFRSRDSPNDAKWANALASVARHLEPLAVQLEAWAAGEEGDGVGSLREAWAEIQAMPRREGSLAAALEALFLPPAEARRRLGLPPACSNPACANLAGDSEVGLRLQQCGRCGQASYCCRECQTAHWKAGHKEACGGGSGGGSKAA
ncbi:hypothetical protein HYH03_009227 [Edaphochlamys debaryana]|uniref:phytol kinase n=1 Tax=Edaphochlamys debaryana TaxID=47281 RepID=A0A836BXI0_9CHLO|nr:hypothetical protein HYH03_009227 [Edaphochlamys debaryana]|eukprot:KAG2492565.1 hypothetical protein HYH03_009227 [Edaphochlamys debaryana]